MANIQISELRNAGYELFQDSETFLNELGEREMNFVTGGIAQINYQYTNNINYSQSKSNFKSKAYYKGAFKVKQILQKTNNIAQTFVNG